MLDDDGNMVQQSQTLWSCVFKRWFDVAGSLILLTAVSPVLLVAALLIKLTSAGPILFTQDRAGKDGLAFRVLKLRTMRGSRKPDPKELVPLDHPEITGVGRIFRRLKIDELPQLINVLKGDMSLVGPRPTLLDQAEAYDGFRRTRLLLRPGATGLAQVNCSAQVSWDERILYDVVYVSRCSFWLDVTIFFRTIFVLVLGEQRMTRPFSKTPYARLIEIPEDYFNSSD